MNFLPSYNSENTIDQQKKKKQKRERKKNINQKCRRSRDCSLVVCLHLWFDPIHMDKTFHLHVGHLDMYLPAFSDHVERPLYKTAEKNIENILS